MESGVNMKGTHNNIKVGVKETSRKRESVNSIGGEVPLLHSTKPTRRHQGVVHSRVCATRSTSHKKKHGNSVKSPKYHIGVGFQMKYGQPIGHINGLSINECPCKSCKRWSKELKK